MFCLKDKIAVVTGAANGIGASIVTEFLKEGAKYVAILDIDEQSGSKLIEDWSLEYGIGKVKFWKCDVTKTEKADQIIDKIVEENGYIDVVVNNVGTACETIENYIKLIEINFTALVSLNIKTLEIMRADKGGQGGTIINISSITALSTGIGHYPIYSATKSAVLDFSNRLGMKDYFSKTNVRVITICFGVTDTGMLGTCAGFSNISNEAASFLFERINSLDVLQSPEEAAKGVVEAYKNGKSESTWLINRAVTTDITEKIKKGRDIMSSDVIL